MGSGSKNTEQNKEVDNTDINIDLKEMNGHKTGGRLRARSKKTKSKGRNMMSGKNPINAASKLASKTANIKKKSRNDAKPIIKTKKFAQDHSHYLHVQTGYRVDYTFSESIWSIFQLHNETINVWVHMLGACIFLYFLLSIGTIGTINNHDANHITTTSTPGGAIVNSNNIFEALQQATASVENSASSLYIKIETARVDSYKLAMERFRMAQFTMEGKKTEFINAAKESSIAMKQKILNLKLAFEDSLVEMASSGKKLLKLQSDYVGANRGKLYEMSQKFKQSIDEAKNFGREYVLDTHEYVLDKDSIALWPMSIFIITAIYCMSCSSAYHLLSSLDESTVAYYRKLDLAGISLLICGSPYPYIYYHICSSQWVAFYLAGFTIVSSFTFSFAFIDYEKIFKIHPETFRVARTLGYIVNGLIFLVPVSHIVYGHYYFDEPLALDVLKLLVYEGGIYTLGSLFYVKGWPEVWSKSGRFDIFFSSHQIWHLTVLIACWVHYIAMVRLYRWRQNNSCPIL